MAAFVTINRSAGKGGALGSLLDQAKANMAQITQIYWPQMLAQVAADNNTTISAIVSGSVTPTVFTTLETFYGIPTGSGGQVYAAIKQAVTDFAASAGLAALTQIG